MQAFISRGKNPRKAWRRWESRIPGINLVPQALAKIKGIILMIGKVISHYRILEELGRGGMGVVYKTEDTKLKRTVALKFLSPELTSDPEAKERFIQEAQAASALDHPNICNIHEIDETEEGQMFICMSYYEGKTLKKKIEQGPLKLEEVIDIAIHVAQGLAKAHEAGITHRDIKPANIMITERGEVKILDFGLVKLAGQSRLIKNGRTMGTVTYMSPEQARGKDVDHRTDTWSLGVVLYEMSVSKLPFDHEYEATIIYLIIDKSPQAPTEIRDGIPEELERIILKCLRKEPKDRYQSPQQLLSDLTKLKKILEKEKYEVIVDRKEKSETKKEAERRQSTVMCAEISGYNEMLESMDVEEVAKIMNRCSEIIGTVAQKHGGTIDKITGSNLNIFFGVPIAIEDAPKKAINAAIELRNKICQFDQKENLQIPLDIHVGINTGVVIAGAMGADEKKEYTAIGDTVTLACQLKDLSVKGQICVGPLTYRYTKNEFKYKLLKSITLKGKKEPIPIYELLSVKEKIYRADLGTERMIYSEMVGREKELDKLRLHLLRAINGEGSIVSVVGEAGIGKSRLIAEFREKDEIRRVTFLEGRALSIGQNLSFHPIIDIFKGWVGIKEDYSDSESFSKLEKAIWSIYPDGAAEVIPFIATLMGMKLTGKYAERVKGIEGEALEKLILKNLRELLAEAAEQRPLVFVIEDLHWADLSSIELLKSLYRLAENNRILFINVFRPNYQETGERILDTIKDRYGNYHSEIYLESLDEHQSEILVNNLLKVKGLPSKIKALITKRTEGNPFFIEEVIRSFIDEDVVEFEDGSFRVTEKLDSVVIPETINELLMARIDKLDETTRSLVKVASIIGRNFFYKILFEVAKGIEEIDERLAYLKEVQLILERRRMEEVEYLFKHALVQQAAYESILIKQRKVLHLKVAQAIEMVFKERLQEFLGTLALHYCLGEDLDQAENYLIRAGEKSLSSSASSEALYYYQEALAIYRKRYGESADPKKIAMLEKNIALALFNRGQNVDALEHFDIVLQYYGIRIPKYTAALCLIAINSLINFFLFLYLPFLRKSRTPSEKNKEMIAFFHKKIVVLSTVEPTPKSLIENAMLVNLLLKYDLNKIENGVGFLSTYGILFSFAGISFAMSRKILEFTRPKLQEGDVKSKPYFRCSEVACNLLAGTWENIPEYDDTLVKQCLGIGEFFYTSNYIACYGFQYNEQGHFDKVQQCIDKLNEIGEIYDNDFAFLAAQRLILSMWLIRRQLKEISNLDTKKLDFLERVGGSQVRLSVSSIKINSKLLLQNISSASVLLNQAEEIMSKEKRVIPFYSSRYFVCQFLYHISLMENSLDSDDKRALFSLRKRAYQCGKKAAKIVAKYALDRAEVYRMMGIYYWLTNSQKKALKWWQKSIQVGEQLRARPELARAYKEVGKRLLEPQSKYRTLNGISAETYLERARKLFEEMGLQWDLEELERVKRKNDEKNSPTEKELLQN
jgi:serine/threonine protein kinase